jgi:hypothetical protein
VTDPTESVRRARLAEINAASSDRPSLEAAHGRVWDTPQLLEEFEVVGFQAPFVVVCRKADGVKGSLEFSHLPRFYFNFVADRQ